MMSQTSTNALWTLDHADDENKNSNMPTFTLQLTQGEQQPKLVRCKNTKKIFVTMKDQEGFSDEMVSTWTISSNKNSKSKTEKA